jgi:hypothetical protein
MASHTVAHFIKSLNRNQRNHLRVILAMQSGPHDLRTELGTHRISAVSDHDRKTSLARQSRTIELFHGHRSNRHAVDLQSGHERLEVGR